MEDESRKEKRRKRAEERIRSVEEAQARIDALIARAGGPVMVCRNVQESEKDKHEDTIQALFDIGDYKNGGDLTVWIRELTDTIDRLEVALYNTLNERDQLMKDLKEISDIYEPCRYCKNRNEDFSVSDICRYCNYISFQNGEWKDFWEWRGVPDKEE